MAPPPISGQTTLNALNKTLEQAGHTTVSTKNLARQLRPSEIPDEMCNWLNEVNSSIGR